VKLLEKYLEVADQPTHFWASIPVPNLYALGMVGRECRRYETPSRKKKDSAFKKVRVPSLILLSLLCLKRKKEILVKT